MGIFNRKKGLVTDLSSLKSTVGGSSSGLVKSVADLVAAVSGAPAIGTATLDGTKKIVTIPFAYPVLRNIAVDATFKAAFTVSTDGTTFNALGGTDTVTFAGKTIVVTFNAALSTATNKIKIAASAFLSVGGTANAEIVTNTLNAS